MLRPFNSPEIAACREVLVKHARIRVKTAEIGGNQDTPFEQAFSNLAHAYLKDKAPSLLDYEVGFQLVDRNQENTKAIGVFGFKVGNQWLYAPVFFLNGDLKGHELLYIKNQDMFVPMKENWLNYILNKKPHVLGEEVTRQTSQLGILPPNLYQLSKSPQKFASAAPWVQDVLPIFADVVTTNIKTAKRYSSVPNLPTFLKKAGRDVIVSLLYACKDYPAVAAAINQFHGLGCIKEAIEVTKDKERKSNSVLSNVAEGARCKMGPNGIECYKPKGNQSVLALVAPSTSDKDNLKIAVYDIDQPKGDEFTTLSDKEKTILIRDGVHIKDKRMNVSKAYDVHTELKMQNPTQTDVYEVLVKPGKWEKCLVIFGPYHSCGQKNFVTVICLEKGKKKAWLNIHSSYVWVKSNMLAEGYREWYEKLPDADSLPVKDRGLYVILGQHGQGTLPFYVDCELGDEHGVKTYDVYYEKYANKPRPVHLADNYDPDTSYTHYSDGSRIVLTGRQGASLRVGQGDLYVPKGCKLFTLKEPPDLENNIKKKVRNCNMPMDSDSSWPDPAIQLGNLEDIQRQFFSKTSALKVYRSAGEVEINETRLPIVRGLIHLVKDYGLSEKQARYILDQAALHKIAQFRIKYADEYYDLANSAPSAPSWPEPPIGHDPYLGGSTATQSMQEQTLPIPSMSASQTDRNIYHPSYAQNPWDQSNNVSQIAQQAAQSGQKEVFDTAMIGSLLKATRDDSMVDRWLPDIMKGMDRIGRILMIFYWHQDEFGERYGQSELPELEDGIRNAFEAIGDILLALRQKTVDPYPDETSKIDLGPVANM